MPAGTLQNVVVCAGAAPVVGAVELRNGGSTSIIYCDAARTMREWRYQAYVVDSGSAAYIDAVSTPYDYAQGGALWAFGFAFTLGLWLVAKNIGFVLNAVKRF